MYKKGRTWQQRFWEKVLIAPPHACWEWLGSRTDAGYSQLKVKGRGVYVHRLSYEMHNGSVPEGLVVRHTCHNRTCVNPDHLETGTHEDNMSDMTRAGRQACGESNGRAKLTDRKVLAIRRIWEEGGVTKKELGSMFGVSSVLVSKIVRRKLWKHIK